MHKTARRGAWAIRTAWLAIIVGLLALNLAAQKSSDNSKTSNNPPAAAQAEQDSNFDPGAGQRIFIDPVTRQIVQPTAEDIKALENAGGKKSMTVQAQPKPFINARGGIGVKLDSSFMSYAVAGKDAEGKLQSNCIESDAAAQDAVKSGNVSSLKPTAKEALSEK